MDEPKIRVKFVGRDAHAAYVMLPGHRPESGIVSKSICLDDVVPAFHGPRVQLDFDKQNKLIGIEIVAFEAGEPHVSEIKTNPG